MTDSPKNRTSDAKPQLQLIPPVAMDLMAHSLALGAKHGPWNWRSHKISLMKHLGAILRHTFAIIRGEWEDADGNPHLGAIMATAAIIADANFPQHINRRSAKGA
jgi:hypothetical protein